MDYTRRQKIIKLLKDAISGLSESSTYDRLIDITEKLFLDLDARVVIVMNHREYLELREHLKMQVVDVTDDIGICPKVTTPHGIIDYMIIDPEATKMFGYKTNANIWNI